MTTRPAFREPMVWIVFGLPAASIVAGLGLLFVAINSPGGESVTDVVQRTGQIQQVELGPDALARSMKLSAVLRSGDGQVQLFRASGTFDAGAPLQLLLAHPTDASQDRTLTLQPDAIGWNTEAELAGDHDWLAELSPADGRWRVRGRIKARQNSTHLGPALSGD